MSVDVNSSDERVLFDQEATTLERRVHGEPISHGAGVSNVFNDRDGDAPTLYDRAVDYWREHVGEPEFEGSHFVDFDAEWLPDGDFVLVPTSSKWKAGTKNGGKYRPYYEQHLKIREIVGRDENGEPKLRKGPIALHVEIMPQYSDLVYKDGNPLEVPYGDGSRIVAWSTYADGAREIEKRALDALVAIYDVDRRALENTRHYDSRLGMKAEAHYRFNVAKKNAVVETIEQSKQLIDWGGSSEIDAHQKRQSHGWLESVVESNRWELLGFDCTTYDVGLKIYQMRNWHKRPTNDPHHHPKIEAYFDGASGGKAPHIDDFDDVLDHLRTIVATHAEWAGLERDDLVADDFFDGPAAPDFEFDFPQGRRDMLRQRYEDRATEVYREALKESTKAVYDILRVITEESGATYDVLEDRTGLARSTIRYHVKRLDENGVVERLSNPVLVVYESHDLLERSREILRKSNPGDTVDDMEDRADERRERRERLRDRDDQGDDDGRVDPVELDDQDVGDDTPIGFRYLDALEATMTDVVLAYTDGDIDDQDVRVRADVLPDRLR